MPRQHIKVAVVTQKLEVYEDDKLLSSYAISTGKNGVGEQIDSGCTPRGLHQVYAIIGSDCLVNSVFIARKLTGEIYSQALANAFPDRDWILTRIIRLDGMEPGFNKGGEVDSLSRYIYIHGTPDETTLGVPGSKGCIRMRNHDIIVLADWINVGATVLIED